MRAGQGRAARGLMHSAARSTCSDRSTSLAWYYVHPGTGTVVYARSLLAPLLALDPRSTVTVEYYVQYWILNMESINDMGVYNGSKAKLIDLNGY